MTIRPQEADKALAIIADLGRYATLPAEELERRRSVAIDNVKVALSAPGDVARMAATRALYGSAPYGHPASGTEKSLRAISRADIEAAYRRSWVPASSTLIMSGDITPSQAKALAEKHLGSWAQSGATSPAASAPATAPLKGKLVVVDMPDAGQAAVAVAREGPSRRDPRYYRALVANAILGGGYTARLNQEIRIKRGLSYGSGSVLDARGGPGPFLALTQTRNDAADQVLALTLGEMSRLGTEPTSVVDLVARRASLTGGFGRNIETTSGVASLIAGYLHRGISPATLQSYLPSVVAVTPEEVRSTAAELLATEGSTIVVVGDSKLFLDKLKARYSDLELVSLSELDLNSPNLR